MGARTRAAGSAAHKGGVLFRAPRKLDYMKLVPVEAIVQGDVTALQLPARTNCGAAKASR